MGVHSRTDQLVGCIHAAVKSGAHPRARPHRRPRRPRWLGPQVHRADLEAVLRSLGVDAKIASGGGRMVPHYGPLRGALHACMGQLPNHSHGAA
jgi:hypothetical protein